MSNPLILNVNRNWHLVFKPAYSLIMLFGIALCFVAAFWQYNKSVGFKTAVYNLVEMQGKFLDEFTYYLDNQTLDGKAGYAVITPFASHHKIFLVNRGFILYEQRDILPAVEDVQGQVSIQGIESVVTKPLLLNDTLQDPLAQRLQFINTSLISKKLNHALEPMQILQQSGAGVLTPIPMKSPYLSHHRHQAYAVQWLILGLCGLLILMIASLKRGDQDE